LKLIDLKPDFIEINFKLKEETIKKLLGYAEKKNVKTILAQYLDYYIEKEKIIQIMKSIQNLNPTIIKIVVLNLKTIYEAIELLTLYQFPVESKIVIVGGGEKGKIISITAPFLGAEFSYGYLSRITQESQININILKKNFEVLNQSFTSND